MRKRWVTIVLALLLTLPTLLAGCAIDTDTTVETAEEDTTGAAKAMTITLYAITGESTKPEAVQAVQDALNEITENTYNTHVELRLYTEDEYFGVIEEKFQNIITKIAEEEEAAKLAKEEARSLKAAGITTAEPEETDETTAETEETVINEFGRSVVKFPEAGEDQVDIFLVRGLDRLTDYIEKGYLMDLGGSLGTTGKGLNKYINPALFSAVTFDAGVMAIPNNRVLGEYTYMLINKELCDKYYYDADTFTTLAKVADFLADVKKYEPDYIPLYGTPFPLVDYITTDMVGSLIGGYVSNTTAQNSLLTPKSFLGTAAYTTLLNQIHDFTAAGYLTPSNYEFNPNAAVQLVKGGYEIRELYKDDYYVQVYSYPRGTNQNMYESMYCVSAYTANVDRCVEIIAMLTKNEEVRNLFQYGVEKIHYEFDDDTGYVKMLSSDYSMNIYDTGNQFKLWPNTDMSEDMLKLAENNWQNAKNQNLELVVSPYVGFTLKYIDQAYLDKKAAASPNEDGSITPISYSYKFTQDIIDGVIAASKEIQAKLDNFKEYTDPETGEIVTYADYIKLLKTELDANEFVAAFLDADNSDSPVAQYTDWQSSKYPPAA
jgi:hypothetical protein